LIENFKVGGLAKFGLDYASLSKDNPRLIYCSITGFGQTGPYAARAGYDLMAQGMGGIMDLTGTPDGEPQRAGVPVADIFTGIYSVVGILAALIERGRTGRGCQVDTALVDSQVGVLANQALNYLVSGKVPARIGNAHPNIVPYQVFPVADGHIIIATGNDTQFAKLCGVLGEPDISGEPNYRANSDRLQHREELIARLSALTRRWRGADLLAKLESTCQARPPRPGRYRAYARRSSSAADPWLRNGPPRGSANTRRKFCARSARGEARDRPWLFDARRSSQRHRRCGAALGLTRECAFVLTLQALSPDRRCELVWHRSSNDRLYCTYFHRTYIEPAK